MLTPVKARKTISVLIILLIAKKVLMKKDSRTMTNSSRIPTDKRPKFKIL